MRDYAVLRSDLDVDLQSQESFLCSDMTIGAARALWMRKSFWKKFQDEISPLADQRCLDLFKQSNQDCRQFAFRPSSTMEETVIGEVKSAFDNLFHRGPEQVFSTGDVFNGVDIGPGASVDCNSFNFFTKLFDSGLSCTDDQLHRLYRSSISFAPEWLQAEKARNLTHGVRIVEGNRLSFVPKTSEISRSICTEPVLNMYFQKGLGSVFQKLLLKRFKINLSTQPDLNRRMALKGSIDQSFGTIDLSSASDSVSLLLLKEVLPSYVFRWICLTRSPYTIFPDGTKEELHMVSTMGNAFTFPLQTLLFSTIVTSCYRVLGISPKYSPEGPENFAVFGDDIIVRKDAYDFVIKCLVLFGFKVNVDKSFNCGWFRESCGGDFWHGHDIRGVYLQSLKTRADIYSAINRITRWSAKSGILLPRVVKTLMSWVKFLPIPWHAGDSEGIKTPHAPTTLKRNSDTGGVEYHAYCKNTVKLKVPNDVAEEFVYHGRKGSRKGLYNPSGLLISFIGGYIRRGRITLRDERETFRVRRRVTSRWRGSISAFAAESIEVWARKYRGEARINLGTPPAKSFVSNYETQADPKGLRDDWEIIAELYFA